MIQGHIYKFGVCFSYQKTDTERVHNTIAYGENVVFANDATAKQVLKTVVEGILPEVDASAFGNLRFYLKKKQEDGLYYSLVNAFYTKGYFETYDTLIKGETDISVVFN